MFKGNQVKEVVRLVEEYIQNDDSKKHTAFDSLYRLFIRAYKPAMIAYERSTVEMDRWEVQAMYEEVFMKVLFKLDEGAYTSENFIKILNVSLRNQQIQKNTRNLMRQRKRNEAAFNGSILSLDQPKRTDNGDNVVQFEAKDNRASFEPQIAAKLDNTLKTDAQKKALVRLLLKKANDKQRLFAETLLECDFNFRKAGRKLKSHHETVKRTVQSISIQYDEHKFGDVKDWLVLVD